MQCPTCNRPYLATDVRCIDCGATLIYEAHGHSKEFKQAANALDSKMFAGIGAIAGFFIAAVVLKFIFTAHWLSDEEIYTAAVVAGVLGAVIGRVIQKKRLDP